MKFSLAKEHKDYFEKQGWIEFEDLLTDSQISQFNQALDEALKERFSLPDDKMKKLSSEVLFNRGRDLWRDHTALRNLVTQPRLAEIASKLVEVKPLRLGYVQFFPAMSPSLFQTVAHQSYENFTTQATNLVEFSSVREVAAGALICLGPETDESIPLFAKGHVIFFRFDAQLDLSRLRAHPKQRYLLIVYTEVHAHYVLEPRDPHTHDLKKLDYVFNDKLKDKTHPVVFR